MFKVNNKNRLTVKQQYLSTGVLKETCSRNTAEFTGKTIESFFSKVEGLGLQLHLNRTPSQVFF